MTEQTVIHLAVQAMMVALKLAGPILVVSLVVGLVISLFQSATQINDYTFTFVPKLAAVALVLLVTGHFMLATLTTFTQGLFTQIPHLLGG